MKTIEIAKIVDPIIKGKVKGDKALAITLDDLVFKKLYKDENKIEEETTKEDIYNWFYFKDDAESAIELLGM